MALAKKELEDISSKSPRNYDAIPAAEGTSTLVADIKSTEGRLILLMDAKTEFKQTFDEISKGMADLVKDNPEMAQKIGFDPAGAKFRDVSSLMDHAEFTNELVEDIANKLIKKL